MMTPTRQRMGLEERDMAEILETSEKEQLGRRGVTTTLGAPEILRAAFLDAGQRVHPCAP